MLSRPCRIHTEFHSSSLTVAVMILGRQLTWNLWILLALQHECSEVKPDDHLAVCFCRASSTNPRICRGQHNIVNYLTVRCKLWLEQDEIIVVQGKKESMEAQASTDAHVLPEVSLAMLETMAACDWTNDLAFMPFQRLGPDQMVKYYNRPKAKNEHFVTHKEDSLLPENSIPIAFKAAATWQQLLGGVDSEGKRIFADERMRFVTKLVRCRDYHMNHYRLVFKKQCVEQPLGTKPKILHIQISLDLQLNF
jgi:hypothetical protein